VRGLRVDADDVGVGQGRDEREHVPGRRQVDVPARLVGLGLQRQAQFEPLRPDVRAKEVDRLAVALQCVARIACHAGLDALAAAPEHEDAGAELGGKVNGLDRLS